TATPLPPTPTPTLTPVPPTATLIPPTPTPSPQPFQEFNLTAQSFFFTTNSITVNQGDLVRVTVTNLDSEHTFTIDELNVDLTIPALGTATIEFTALPAGTYLFYCGVGGHRGAGMEGAFIVLAGP
ncbi:MAG: cupredoxin domain-containing protein, partial [Chloroflexi bacterium]|nr:cupredoxin domain-containing protein [Chloroflexota bacterium]